MFVPFEMFVLRKSVAGHTVHDKKTYDDLFFLSFLHVSLTKRNRVCAYLNTLAHTPKMMSHYKNCFAHDFEQFYKNVKKKEEYIHIEAIELQMHSGERRECFSQC